MLLARWKRYASLLAPAGLAASVALSGCARLWDDMTANGSIRWTLLFDRTPPLVVLAESHDGDLRARAFEALKEPKQNGGTDQDQTMVVELLAVAAREEPQTICRLAAIEKLGEFKDPRAAKALVDAFYAPANFGEKNAVVRIATLKSLARTGDPAAIPALVAALESDPSMDVRMTAADSLGRFRQGPAAEALVRVLQNDRDVALRYQAQVSLQEITGKDLPPNAEAWQKYLKESTGPDQQLAKSNEHSFKLTSWFQGGN